jgi:aminoglycoside phosphotransferase (APT) family kinase protein
VQAKKSLVFNNNTLTLALAPLSLSVLSYRWLSANIPPESKASVVHGDFRLDNLILKKDSTDVLAVLDWE